MIGNMGASTVSNQDDVYREFLKIVADPSAFDERKKMLDSMRADIDKLITASTKAKENADRRIQEAVKVETANNLVKMALDKRNAELDVRANKLQADEDSLNSRAVDDHSTMTRLRTIAEQEIAATKASLETKQSELNALAADLKKQDAKLKADQTLLAQAQKLHQESVEARAKQFDNRDADIVKAQAELVTKQEEFKKQMAAEMEALEMLKSQHEHKVSTIKALILSLNSAI